MVKGVIIGGSITDKRKKIPGRSRLRENFAGEKSEDSEDYYVFTNKLKKTTKTKAEKKFNLIKKAVVKTGKLADTICKFGSPVRKLKYSVVCTPKTLRTSPRKKKAIIDSDEEL